MGDGGSCRAVSGRLVWYGMVGVMMLFQTLWHGWLCSCAVLLAASR